MDSMEKDKKYWEEEIRKCKESPLYFINTYSTAGPITQEQYDRVKNCVLIKGRGGYRLVKKA